MNLAICEMNRKRMRLTFMLDYRLTIVIGNGGRYSNLLI